MTLSWTTWKHWLSVAATAFVGGATGYLQANLMDVADRNKWKAVAFGALLAGMAAVTHLAQVPAPKGG